MCDARGQGERVCVMRVLCLVQARLARCRELDELLLHYAVHGAQVTVETGGIQRKTGVGVACGHGKFENLSDPAGVTPFAERARAGTTRLYCFLKQRKAAS